ncbi:MAG: D-alanyl-D-alanine carboxypeptidase/D-alanyl-D-alanine-endopeptidase [Deltaproteobacteria bacterium HGW-Deltaproteobacteria-14]|jgi:D-alanyl-D-alanine carboxypeptidase/D-alanyl-D-alanine-endopeptidase (penicillin-binding protein 4)|nr:MAG: D-alanyl-D-alanine carboxypeptidase/D-alanyl-D-alanine-endopeptidase [Deltaproteobacteria bacterium HGW-Deltaproteobacteria-14]
MSRGIGSRVAIVAVAVAVASASVGLWSASASARGPAAPAQATIDRWAADKALAGATVGVSVMCTRDGAVWGERNGDRLLVPASGTKLLVSAAALDLLPPDVAWPTSAHGVLTAGGRIDGDLVIVGRGDPQLLPDDLEALADQLVAAGVHAVAGDLVVDTGCFDGGLLPPAFDMKVTDGSYRPSVSCAGSNYGAVRVVIKPGREVGAPVEVRVDPASDAVVVTSRAKTIAGKSDSGLSATATDRDDGRTSLVVEGELGVKSRPVVVRKRVADPGLLTGAVLARFLDKRGIAVAGQVRVDPGAHGAALPELASVASPTLADALHDMNTWSNNSMAETLFMHLGAGAAGEPATWARAQRAVADALLARGLPAEAFAIVNGSGLYEATRITPHAFAALLATFAGDDPKGAVFRASLAVAGESGTLEWRLRANATRGLVRAKTGTLDGVTSISGYVPAASGCLLAFAVLINDGGADDTSRLRRAADRLILSLARL